MNEEDEAFEDLERTIKFRDAFPKEYDVQSMMRMEDRNDVLEEVAKEFEKMPFGDTAASFAVFVRSMKR
jgi:hypothetical protein